jgi:REP element-mobilizing transposase RayT
MPNHVHGIIVIIHNETNPIGAIGDRDVGAIHELPLRNELSHRRRMLIPKIVGYFKMNTAKEINQIRNTPGVPVWQRNYYEHIIRDERDLDRIRAYIAENPLRWPEDEENPIRHRQRERSAETI